MVVITTQDLTYYSVICVSLQSTALLAPHSFILSARINASQCWKVNRASFGIKLVLRLFGDESSSCQVMFHQLGCVWVL